MSVAYKIETASTGNQPSRLAADDLVLSLPELGVPEMLQSQLSNSTSFADSAVTLGFKLDPLLSNLNRYSDKPIPLVPDGRRAAARRWSEEQARALTWYPAALRKITSQSSATQPPVGPNITVSSEDQYRTGLSAPFIIAIGIRALASKEADDLLVGARSAARANDMRAAYEKAFRGLDIILRSAEWNKVSSELEEICSDNYPAAFGIGAVRFASGAASRIPNWDLIIKRLIQTARQQKVDVSRAMRGLLGAHGVSQGR